MRKNILFLLHPSFIAENGERQICPDCAMIEGILATFPDLPPRLDVRHVDFAKPRRALMELGGKPDQSCPAFVRTEPSASITSDMKEILTILHREYDIPAMRGIVDSHAVETAA